MSDPTDLTREQRRKLVREWRLKLEHSDPSVKTLGLHGVMCHIEQLKSKHTATSLDDALAELFPYRSTRARLRRLHAISEETLKQAMKTFEETKLKEAEAQNSTDTRCSKVLTISHLEALARCMEESTREELLTECATNGWSAMRLRREVTSNQKGRSIQPLKLAKQICLKVEQLNAALARVKKQEFIGAVDRVKKEHRKEAIKVLLRAANALANLSNKLDIKSEVLTHARTELKGKGKA